MGQDSTMTDPGPFGFRLPRHNGTWRYIRCIITSRSQAEHMLKFMRASWRRKGLQVVSKQQVERERAGEKNSRIFPLHR